MPSVDVRPATPRRGSRWSTSQARAGSDRRLVRRASQGDRRAIAAIFERYQQELYGFCLGLLGEPQDAQDALQNTMVKVLRALPGEEREIALRPWLYRIARNEAIELRRSRRPTQALDGRLVDRRSEVAERAEQREQLEGLLRDLGDLPERQRTVLVMRELSGLDFAEIGAALDTTGAVVRQSLYEARRNLEQMERGRGLGCDAVARVLSDGDRRTSRRRDIRAHLRDCPDCSRFRDSIERRQGILATIPPVSLPAGAAAGVAQALFGGSGGSAAAGLTVGVAKSAGTYGALKAALAVGVVAVVGTAAMQSETKGPAPDRPPGDARSRARDRPAPAVAPREALAAGPASAKGSPARPAPASGARGPRLHSRSPRPAHPSLVAAHGAALEGAARPIALRPPAPAPSAPATRPEAGSEATSAPATEAPRSAKDEGEPGQSGQAEMRSESVPGQKGAPPGQEQRGQGAKTPPGQAKKQAPAEPAPTRPASSSPAEAEPAALEAGATEPGTGAEPKGKSEGRESSSPGSSGRD